MFLNPDRGWSARVDRAFDTRPRDGASPGSVWLPRRDVEDQFSDLLFQDGVHICVDGPSGTGKTSLVLTQLSKEKKKVIKVQLTNSMKWTDLCREIIGDLSRGDSSFSLEALIGLNPELKVGYGRKSKVDSLTRWKAVGSQINEMDLCRAVQSTKSILFIDDFEKADESIVTKIADVCKLMTQSFNGKIIIVGTDNIYFRIMSQEPALESRLAEISVGALPSIDDGWDFLCLGFDSLGITHPGKIYNERSLSGPANHKLRDCKAAIHDAVASLPKALNEFGRRVCLNKGDRVQSISLPDLMQEAKDTFFKKLREYAKNFPELQQMFAESPEIRILLRAIYDRSVGSILHREDLYRDVVSLGLNRDQFEQALLELVKEKFITQTGRSGETLFISRLYMAHIFGVCAKKYEQYGLDPKIYGLSGQLSLPLKSDISNSERN